MLKTHLVHPQILAALAGAGHGSLVLIADGNYPASTSRGPNADLVYLNLVPGTIDALTVLRAMSVTIPIEEAYVMAPLTEGPNAMAGAPPIWQEFASVLAEAGHSSELKPMEPMSFYDIVATRQVALVVVTGDTRHYANLLLRIGAEPDRQRGAQAG